MNKRITSVQGHGSGTRSSARSGRRGRKRFSQRQALEPRILFDATAGAAIQAVDQLTTHSDTSADSSHAADADHPTDSSTAQVPRSESPALADFHISSQDKDHAKDTNKDTNIDHSATPDLSSDTSQAKEILFIESSSANYQHLVDNARPNVEIITLDPNKDGYDQITNALAERHDISTIHILTDGKTGESSVASDVRSEQALDAHAAEVGHWKDSLAPNANVLIYGSAEQGEASKAFLDQFYSLSGTNVAAANNIADYNFLRGSASFGVEIARTVAPPTDASTPSGAEQTSDSSHTTTSDQSTTESDKSAADKATIDLATADAPASILFVNQGTDPNSYQTLIDNASGPVTVITLDANQDGYQQITDALSQYSNVFEIYFLSEGSSGTVTLGNTVLSEQNLTSNAEQVTTWNNHLQENGNIVIYADENIFGVGSTQESFLYHFSDIVGTTVVSQTVIDGVIVYDPTVSRAEGYATTSVVTTASDQSGLTVNYALVGTHASYFTVDSNGQVFFVAVPDYETGIQSYSFTINGLRSNGTIRTTEAFIVNITNVAPNISSSGSASINEGVAAGSVVYTSVAADPAGGVLTYTLTGTDAAAFTINSAGVVTMNATPNFETKSSYSFTVRATDAGGLFDTQAVALSINDLAPVITSPTTANINEGVAAGTAVYTTVAADPGGGTITYALIAGGDASSFTINSSTGVVTINAIPNFETKSSYTFTVRARDADNTQSTQLVTLTINDLAPTFSSATTASVNEAVAAGTIVYSAVATDPAGGTVTYSLQGTDASAFSINSATGFVTINAIPNFETKSSYSFDVKASDPSGVFSIRTVTLSINNLAPTISNFVPVTIFEGIPAGSLAYTVTAADPAGGTVTYSLLGTDASAFSINSSGQVTFNAIPNFEAKSIYNFTVRASDAGGAFSDQALSVVVNNAAPAFSSSTTASVNEAVAAGTTVYTAVAPDPGGGTVTYSLVAGGDASSFSINSSTGAVTINAIPNFEVKNSYTFTVKAQDPSGLFVNQTVTLSITDLPPVISSGTTANINEAAAAGSTVYTAVAADPAGGTVTYSLTGTDASAFTINSSTGVVTINASPDFETKNSYSFDVKASDASGVFSTQAVTLSINDLPPVISSGTTANVNEGIAAGATVYTAIAADPNGGTVTYSLTGTDASAFTINSSTGVVTINASPDFETKTSYSFNVKASDANGAFNTQAVTLTINDLPPVISSGSTASVNEGIAAGSTVYTTVAADPSGGTITYSLTGTDAAAFTINSSGVVTINAIPNFEVKNSYSFNVRAQDPSGLFNTQAVTLTINDLPPVISSGTTANVNEAVTAGTTVYTAVAADPAGGTVTYSLTGTDAAAFTINSSTGIVTINASPDFETKSSYSFNVRASDASGAFSTQAVTLSINDLPPVISSGTTANVNEGIAAGATVYTAIAADPNGGTVTYSLTGTDASAFTINSSTGVVTINASPDFETKNSYSFNVRAQDPNGAFNTQAVTLTINDLPPVISSGSTASVNEGIAAGSTVYTTVAADPSGGVITYSLTGTDAAAFTINSSGVVTINAIPNFEVKNSYSFNVRAQDPSGLFNTQAVTLTINDLPPVISSATTANVNEAVTAGTAVYTAVAADPAGGTVTYSLTGTDAGAFTINSSTGIVTINASPDFETKSSYSFNVRASDASGAFSTQAVTLSINDLPPVISSGTTANVNEGIAAGATVYTAIAADPNGGTVTYSLTGTDASAFTINSSTGVVTINASPDFETKNSYSFNVRASDANGAFNTQAVTLSINDLPPVISSGTTASVNEGVTAGSTVYTAAAADPSGGTVTYALTGTDAGAFTINSSTGVVTINASPDFETKNSYSFSVRATDASGAFSTQAVTLSINDLPPVISSGTTASINEGITAGTTVYTASATDPNGGIVSYSLTGADANAFTINSSTGVVTINASPDFETKNSYSFNVRASDANGQFNTQAITLSINDLPPVISSGTTANVNEGITAGSTVYTAVAADPNGGAVTYSLTGTDAAAFTINSSTGLVTINASPDFETKNSYSFNVRASDANGAFNTQAVTLTINDLPPVITSGTTASINEAATAGSTVYTAIAADPNGGTVTYSLTGTDASAFTINSSTGVVTINASPDFETKNSYSFNVRAADANGAFNTQAVTLTINDLPPNITSGTTASVNEGITAGSTVYTAVAADPNGGTVTYTLTGTDASAFTINSSTGVVTINASPDFETKNSYSFNVRASDASGAFSTQAVTLSINDLPPVISSGATASVNEGVAGGTTVYTAVAADPNGGTVTYALTGTDAGAFTINSSTGVVTINASPDFETKNSYSFNVRASDANGQFNTQAITLSINDLPPVISSGNTASINEGATAGSIVYTAVAADPNGGTVTYSLTGTDASAFTINSSTGVVTINASPDFETKNSYSFNVRASDANGQFNTQAVTLTINDLPPNITSGSSASVNEGIPTGATVYTAVAADPNGGAVTYSLTGTDAAAFTVNSSTGVVTINASPDFETKSSYSFNVRASDANGQFNTQAVTLTINDLPPNITSGSTATAINEGAPVGTVIYTATAADPNGGAVTYALTGTDASAFTINSSTGVVTINASPDFETKNSYSFDVKASDASGQFNTQAVTLSINDLPPVISSGTTANVNEGITAGSTVYTAVAADPNGGAVTYALTGTDASAFTINSSTGVVTINASPDFETKNSYSFDVKASDASGQFNTQAITLSINDLPPVISSGNTASINEGATAGSIVYTAVAADPNGGTVTYALTGTDASAFTINSSTGVVTINASPDFETKNSYSFNVRASDANGAFNSQAITVSINDLPPVISSGTTANVNEGITAGSTVYTAVAADPNGGAVTYALTGTDASAFTINSSTGVVTINASPDFETKNSYSFNVRASDANGQFNTQAITLSINDLPPVISSGSTASINEGATAGSTVYTAVAADPNGGAVTYSLTGTDASAFTINSSTGVVTINASPDFETKNSYSFNVRAADANGAFNTQAITVSINDLPPVISSGNTASINEGATAGSTVYTAVAADPNGGAVTYALTGTDASAFTINSSTGVVTINASPDFETKSSYSFNVRASDASGAFSTQAVTLNINDLPPVISSGNNASINEGSPAGTAVYTAVAADPNGGAVTYSLTGTDASAFTINSSTGVVTINASPDFETKNSYSFNVRASDANGAFNSQAITVSINDLPPVISSGNTASINEGSPAGSTVYTAVAADPNGGAVTYALTGTDASAFTINSSTGVVTINASPDFETKSSYSFNVRASDANGAFNSQAITVSINDLPPVISSGNTASINEGATAGSTVYTAVAADPNGGAVTYSLTGTDASAFTINSSTGVVTINASPDFETKNSYSFNVRASDANGQFNTQAITLNINDLPPVISSGNTASINEGVIAGSTVYTAAAADPNGGTVTYALTGTDASAFTINSSTGVVTINASPDFETKNSYSFNVRASDANGAFSTQAVTLSINDLPPVISSGNTASINEGIPAGSAVYAAIAADPNGGTVTYALTGTDASAFTINSSTGVVTINASPDFETKNSYNFNVQASDASGAFSTQAVTLSINDLPPVISSGNTASINEGVAGGTIVYTAVAADPNGGAVTYALTGTDASAFTINSSTGVVTINASPDFETKNSYSFNVRASDANGAFNSQAITVSINDLPPVISSGNTASINEGSPAGATVYTAVAADPNGGVVTYALTGTDASAFTINSSTGVVTINASPDFETKSSYNFNVQASDANGAFSTQAVTLSINDLPPVISSGNTANINEGSPAGSTVYTAVAADPNGGAVTYSLTGTDASAFTINSSTGVVTINASPDFETKNSYSFNVRASDANGQFNTQAITLSINDLPPVISSGNSASINEGVASGTTVYTAIAADPNGGTITYALTGTDASAFTINSSTGVVTINASPDFETKNSYSFNVQASDASGAFNSQAITVSINDLPPVISSGNTASINEGSPAGSSVYTAVAADPNGGAVTYALTGTDASAFTINSSTGAVTINASPDFETKNSYSFNVQASDANGAFSTQAVTLSINDLPPVISSGNTASINEGVAGGTTVYTAVAADPNGGTVTYALTGTDAAAFTINSSTGVVTINASPDFETKNSYSFNVQASDASGAFSTQAINVSVNDLPPVISSGNTASINEGVAGGTTVYTAVAADPSGGAVTYSLSGTDASAFTINSSTGAVTINASPDFETKNSYSFNVQASDASGAFTTQTVTLSINDLPPVISSGAIASVNEGIAAGSPVYTTIAADPSGGAVTYSLSGTDASAFTLDSSTGVVTINAMPNYEVKNSYNFTVTASDANGAFTSQAVTININDLPPVISSGNTANINEGVNAGTMVYTANAADPAGGTVTYSLMGTDASAFTINSSTGVVTINSIPDYETKSSYSFTVRASDASGAFSTQAVTLSINDLAPVISSDTTASVNEGVPAGTAIYTAIAADPAGGTVTYSLEGTDASAFSINSATGVVTINAMPDFENKGSYSFTIKASDPSGLFTTEGVTLSINDLPPVITSATTANVNEGVPPGTMVYTANAADPAGGTVTYSLTGTDAAGFSINSSTGVVTINAMPDFETKSSYSFNVKASDDSGLFITQAVTLNINNLPPTITSSTTTSIPEGTSTAAIIYTAVAGDPGDSTVNYTLTGPDASAFTINAATGAVTMNAVPDFETKSTYALNIKASDAQGMFSNQSLTVNITNLAPVISSPTSVSVADSTPASSIVYTAIAVDPAGGDIHYALSGEDASAFTIDAATGAITFNATPSYATKSSYSVMVEASDASGATHTQSVLINVAPPPPPASNAIQGSLSNVLNTNMSDASNIPTEKAGASELTKDSSSSEAEIGSEGLLGSGTSDIINVQNGVNNANVINNVNYNVSAVGAYGTLYVNTATGQYAYAANENATGGDAKATGTLNEHFVIAITGNNGQVKNFELNINLNNTNKLGLKPVLTTSLKSVSTPSEHLSLTKGITGETVVGTVHYQPGSDNEKQVVQVQGPDAQGGGSFDAHLADLLKDFGLTK